jgi:hypothetical protein
MKHARLLILLLILATVSVDLAATVMITPMRDTRPSLVLSVAFVSLPMSQIGLLSAWAALGKTPAPWRAVGLVLPLALWSYLMGISWATAGSSPAIVITSRETLYLVTEALAIVALLGTGRAAGLKLTTVGEAAMSDDQEARRRYQFSLGYLFSWLTATAIVLAALGYTFDLSRLATPGQPFSGDYVIAAPAHAILVSASLYVVLAKGRRFLRGAVGLAALVTAAGLLWRVNRGVRTAGLLVASQAIWLILSLSVVRVAGYRLVWRRRSAPPQPPRED